MAGSMSRPQGAETDQRFYPVRPFVAASVAVFRGDRVLLAARTKPPADQMFSLPGGLVETGETLQEAALRELEEEVGVKAEIAGFAGQVEVIERDDEGRCRRHFVVNAFAARWREGEGHPSDEAADVVWAGPREVEALAITPGLAGILTRAREILEIAG
jgi:ADP-ribose pyrophosphatase YjhB (NUDIX family)